MNCTISYISTASQHATESVVNDLLAFVEHENNLKKVYGILIYADGTFFQIIEGEEAIIKPLFNKILKDPRHHHVIKLLEKPSSKISFSKYHSSFTAINSARSRGELEAFINAEEHDQDENFKRLAYVVNRLLKSA